MKANVAHLAHRSLRYFESGGGRPVLLLHAFPLSADQWLPQLHRVPVGFRFVAPDLRGFRGMGAAFEDPGLGSLSIDDYAQDALALAAHLDLDRFVVCGLSMGGYIAFALHRLAPGRIAGLILSNTRAGADSAEGRAGRERMIELARQEGPEAIAREMVPRLLGETTRREQPDLADAVRRLILVNSTDGIVSALGALKARPDSTPGLGAIDCPALIITGSEDAIISLAEAETMQRGIRNASLVVLPKVGHLSNLEAPVGWSKAVDAALTRMI
ncbi:MAG TPA: alpha/beta fold hydrolase [Vicinamibacterales bacterium]|nr:alpha/beta fold hydrolase [Vicinamibacterales bacterium]